jgi:inner membrane protein
VALSGVNALLIAAASVLPDFDTAASYPGRLVPVFSKYIERRFGHRTLTHSALFIIALSVLLVPIWLLSPDSYICILAGCSSHPFLDTMTVHGVKLFYPLSNAKCVFPLEVNNPHRYRIQTGSKMDKILGVLFLLGCIPVFLIAHQGYERFIRSTQRNIESAVRDYNDFSRDNLVFASTKAYNSMTRNPLEGMFEIVGALNPSTLIFKGPEGELHTLGKEFEADYVVEDILCEKGSPARSVVRSIDLSNQLLSQIVSYVDTSLEHYLFGDLSTSERVSLPENVKIFSPVTGSGGTIELNHARYRDIQMFSLEFAFISKGILTVKSILPAESHPGYSASSPALLKLENFTHISLTLDPKESIEFFKSRGDTVKEKELIGRKNLAHFYQDQITLNERRIQSLEQQTSSDLSDLDQRITTAEQATKLDSMEHLQLAELSLGGFIPGRIVKNSELKWRKSRTALSQLIATRASTASKSSLEIRKLHLTNRQLTTKANAAEKQSEIRSTVSGILIDIRQVPRNNKTQVTFIIKRTPSPPH